MTSLIFLLFLAGVPQDAKKSEVQLDRATRAATVDRIMAEPPRLKMIPPEPVARPDVNISIIPERKVLKLEPKPQAEVDEGGGPVQLDVRRAVNAREMAVASVNFDRWVFEDDADDETRRSRLNLLLAEKLTAVQNGRQLGPAQLRKLRWAGTGDIKRLFDRVEEQRAEFEAVRQDYAAGRAVLTWLAPTARDFRIGPFGEDSLLAKTLRKLDEEERTARYGPK